MVANFSINLYSDRGRLFENLIFLDLKRRGYQIYYYRTESGEEVDFIVVEQSGRPFIVQACFDISDEETFKREERSLETAKTELKCEGLLVTPGLYAEGRGWMQAY